MLKTILIKTVLNMHRVAGCILDAADAIENRIPE